MKRSLIISAGIFAVAVAAGGLMLKQHAAAQQEQWLAEMQERGVQIALASPLQWQLWPLGLRSGAVTVKTVKDGNLLQAVSAALVMTPSAIFSGKAGELRFEDARFVYRQHSDGSSNWDALFKNSGDSPVQGLVLENASLEIWTANAAQPLEVSIKQLHWRDIGQSVMPLQADFMISMQNATQDNLLLENSLHTMISKASDSGWLLQGLELATTVSSTRLPGTPVLKIQGDIHLQPSGWSSEALLAHADYRAPGLAESGGAEIVSAVQGEWQTGIFKLPKISIKAGEVTWQMEGDTELRWTEKALLANHLVITSTTEKSAVRQLEMTEVAFSIQREAEKFLTTLRGRIGAGYFEIPVTAILTPDSVSIGARASAHQIDLVQLRRWLGDDEAAGLLDLNASATLQGQSAQELLENSAGSVNLILKNGHLGSIAVMPILHERLQSYASLLPELVVSTSPETGTSLRHLQLAISLKQNVFTTEKLSADIDLARLEAGGSYDRHSGKMDYRGTLALDGRLFTTAKGMELPLLCQGNLHEEQVDFVSGLETDCKVDDQAKQDLLGQALIRKFRN